MTIHKNARLTPIRREEMACSVIAGGLSKAQAARNYGVSGKIVSRWTDRFMAEGRDGMQDRSSRPRVIPNQTAQALETGVSPATVSRVLHRAGLSRVKDLAPPEPVVRYAYKEPGGLIHLDIKKLGRFEPVGPRLIGASPVIAPARALGAGWVGSSHCPPLVRGAQNCSPLVQEAAIGAPLVQAQWRRRAARVHICIDDASRVAVTDIFPDDKAMSAIAALQAAVAWYQSFGVTVTRVMTEVEGSGNDPGDHFPAERVVL